MEDTLTNITSAMEQQANRQFDDAGACAGGPVYGPSFNAQFHQFIDMGSGMGSQMPYELAQMDPAFCQAAGMSPYGMCPHCYCGHMGGFPGMPMGYSSPMHHQPQGMKLQKQHWGSRNSDDHPGRTGGYSSGSGRRGLRSPPFMSSQQVLDGQAPEPCQCVHCQAAQLSMTTPVRHPSDQYCAPEIPETPDEQFAPREQEVSPISNTRSPMSQHQQSVNAHTPPRRNPNTFHTPSRRSAEPLQQQNGNSASKQRSERRGRGGRGAAKTGTGVLDTVKTTSNTATYAVTLQGLFGRRFSVLSHNAVSRGEYMIFEGDRGEDLGEVLEAEVTTSPPGRLPLVLRPATPSEVEAWRTTLAEKAQGAVEQCNLAVQELNLPLIVVKAAFQFDRKKLTFFYESDDRVDFRRLLSQMYNKFHCRIWMERTDVLENVNGCPPVGLSPSAEN